MSVANWTKLHGSHFVSIRVLVTGGAGFIGSHLVEALATLGAKVVVLDDLSGGSRENVESFKTLASNQVSFIKGSILDQSLLTDSVCGCSYVFHLAALGSVSRSVVEPAQFVDVNVVGTLNVLEASRAAGVQRVMFAASSSVYGDTLGEEPKIETMPPRPQSPYAATKLAGEALVHAYSASYDLDTAALRYFNVFGPRQNSNISYAAVIASFAKALIEDQRPVIHGDGEQSRDFTFVDNAVHANLLAARCDRPIRGQTINIACGKCITVNELAKQMAQFFDLSGLEPVYEPPRAGDVKHSLADLTRAKAAIGYQPIVEFTPGLHQTVAWYRINLS